MFDMTGFPLCCCRWPFEV